MKTEEDQKYVVEILARQSLMGLEACFHKRGNVWTDEMENIFIEHQGATIHNAKLYLGNLSADESAAVSKMVVRQFFGIKKTLKKHEKQS